MVVHAVIPTLKKTRQKVCRGFKVDEGYRVTPCLKEKVTDWRDISVVESICSFAPLVEGPCSHWLAHIQL